MTPRSPLQRFVDDPADTGELADALTPALHRELVALAKTLGLGHVQAYLALLESISARADGVEQYGVDVAEAWLASHPPPHRAAYEAVVRLLSAAGDPIAAKGWWERFLETPEGRS